MLAVRKRVVAIYVDPITRQWVARDCEGNYWSLPLTDSPWDDRQPFFPAEESELQPVPGHYKSLLGLPVD